MSFIGIFPVCMFGVTSFTKTTYWNINSSTIGNSWKCRHRLGPAAVENSAGCHWLSGVPPGPGATNHSCARCDVGEGNQTGLVLFSKVPKQPKLMNGFWSWHSEHRWGWRLRRAGTRGARNVWFLYLGAGYLHANSLSGTLTICTLSMHRIYFH